MITTPGQLLINEQLPEDVRKPSWRLDKRGVADLFATLAEKHPDAYADIARKMFDTGHFVTQANGTSFSLDDFTPPEDVKNLITNLKQRVQEIATSKLPGPDKEKQIIDLVLKHSKPVESRLMEHGLQNKNRLAIQVNSGSRGNPTQLKQLVIGDMLVADQHHRTIPVPILNGYINTLSPAEYFAASYGARQGVTSVKMGTAKGGFLCLLNSTLVQMADEHGGAKRIDQIKVGDLVVGATALGQPTPVRVTAVFKHGKRYVVRHVFATGNPQDPAIVIEATAEHRVLARLPGQNPPVQRAIGAVRQDWQLVTVTETTGPYTYKDEEPLGPQPTFDLEVDHPDHLFVLANGAIVSNSKQLAMISHRLTVTDHDCGTQNGIAVKGSDKDNVGAVLAKDAGKYKAGTIITPKMLPDLEGKDLLVRSPLTCQAEHGLCATCAGVREQGKLPDIGLNIGLSAAQAAAEPITQGALSAKHTGGAVSGVRSTESGFDYINRLIQSPKVFTGAATLAHKDGRVSAIEPAPQGGMFVHLGDDKHYVSPDQEVTVKVGQQLEAGDALSTGTPNTAELAKHKGIGAARRAFVDLFLTALKNSNIYAHRRNVEVLSRGLINHVKWQGVDDQQQLVPDDILPYDRAIRGYKPRPGAQTVKAQAAEGSYLEHPVLHYSVGTRVTPSVIADLKKYEVPEIVVHKEPPPFEPYVVHGREVGSKDPNWITRMGSSYLERSSLEAVHRGRVAPEKDTSFYGSLAKGTEFGKDISTTGTY